MSNDLVLYSANDKEDADLISIGNKFIPYLSIAYATSPIVGQGKARPGEFIFGKDTVLGQSIEITVLDYRFHACYKGADHKSTAHSYHVRSLGLKSDNKEYNKFISPKNIPAGQRLVTGVDALVYIKGQSSVAVFYMKSSLEKFFRGLSKVADRGRFSTVTTEYKSWESPNGMRVWYDLIIKPTNSALSISNVEDPTLVKDVQVNVDSIVSAQEIFNNPSRGIETVDEEEQFSR